MMKQQGFEQEDYLKGFRAMKQQSSSMMMLRQAELMILIQGSKEEKSAKTTIWFKILLENVIPTKSHHTRIQWWLRYYE
jgi:hypothetical protein